MDLNADGDPKLTRTQPLTETLAVLANESCRAVGDEVELVRGLKELGTAIDPPLRSVTVGGGRPERDVVLAAEIEDVPHRVGNLGVVVVTGVPHLDREVPRTDVDHVDSRRADDLLGLSLIHI